MGPASTGPGAAPGLDPTALMKAVLPRGAANTPASREAAVEYEAVFLSQMVKEMFAGESTRNQFGGGFGEDMFRELLADEYAKEIARAGGIGLADHVYREMLALQEAENK